MDPEAFRAAAHAVVDRIADYLADVERYPVLPPIEPGTDRARSCPAHAPEAPEPIDAILADVDRLVFPNATHWQHPGFFAYFATSASGPGHPRRDAHGGARPEPDALADVADRHGARGRRRRAGCARGSGCPTAFDGLLTDTASTSTLIALAAAREAAGLDASARGLAGRPDLGPPRVYASAEAHSSIEKACMTLGLGPGGAGQDPDQRPVRDGCRGALAAAIAADRAAGPASRSPSSPPIGTTSSTSVDPVAAIADIAAREGLWLHVDAAYAGVVALLPGPARHRSPAGSAPTRSWSTRTSGCSRRSTRRSC